MSYASYCLQLTCVEFSARAWEKPKRSKMKVVTATYCTNTCLSDEHHISSKMRVDTANCRTFAASSIEKQINSKMKSQKKQNDL
jgi:hypothetical protein